MLQLQSNVWWREKSFKWCVGGGREERRREDRKKEKSQRDQPKLKQKKTKTEDEAQGQMTIVDKAHRRTFSLFFPLQI